MSQRLPSQCNLMLTTVHSLWVKARLMSTIEGSVLNGQPVAWRDAVMSVGAGMALALVQITSSGYINRNRNFVKVSFT